MSVISSIAIYFVIWWTVLFVVLPFGVRNAHETGEQVLTGNDAGAPVVHGMGRKFLVTTILATLVFAGIYYVLGNNMLETINIPFMQDLPKA